MQQQYTAMESTDRSTLSKRKEKKTSKVRHQQLQQQQTNQLSMVEIQQSGEDEEEEEASLASQSAGIYRKGHLNERAFSYSIRQEHRSRSYSSLANFPASDDLRTNDKKERELIQMVHDLDLSGDDLERSEVPLAMYPHHRQPR